VAVVTQPDRPAGRGYKTVPTPVKAAASKLGLTVYAPIALRAFAEQFADLAPDVCVVASYGRIVPQALLDVVPAWFNVHPSLLPRYRGATPIQSAIRDGCTETGVTIIAMDAGMDTGDIVAQTEAIAIGPTETYGALHDRLAAVSAKLLGGVLDAYAAGTLTRTPQRHARATVTSPYRKDDFGLVPGLTAKQIVDRIRSVAPRPGLRISENAGLPRLNLIRAHATHASPLVPGYAASEGSIVANRGHLFVPATDGWVVVDEIVRDGKGAMDVAAFARGNTLTGPLPNEAFGPLEGELLPR